MLVTENLGAQRGQRVESLGVWGARWGMKRPRPGRQTDGRDEGEFSAVQLLFPPPAVVLCLSGLPFTHELVSLKIPERDLYANGS